MAVIIAAAGGGNWTTGATWVGSVAPTAADDAQLNASSGAVTITAGAVCRSLDCTGYASTLTHTAGVTLSIGDGTAGAGNVALKLVAGMTYTLGNASTSAINFISTAATQQTIDTGGKTLGNQSWNGVGGSWVFQSGITATGSLTLTAGTLTTNGQAVQATALLSTNTNTRMLTLGSSALALNLAGTAWDTSTTTGLTLNAGTSTITLSGSGATMNSGTLTFNNVIASGAGTMSLPASDCTFNNFTRTGTAVKTDILSLRANHTVSGTFTVNGNSAVNRLFVHSGTLATQRTVTAVAVAVSHADFMDVAGAGVGSWNLAAITGNSGDAGGNTNITFTSSATQTWSGTSGGTWSTNAWSGRVPLPQDDVVVNAAFTASQTITQDMPRIGRSVSFAGCTGGVTFSPSLTFTIYGSLNFTDLGTLATGAGTTWLFGGRNSYTITAAGKSIAQIIQISAPGGTYTMQDALTTLSQLSIGAGTFTTNSQTLTCSNITINGATGTLVMGSSIINLTSTATITLFLRSAGNITPGTPTINVVNASANTRTINVNSNLVPGGGTFNYTVAGSPGALVIIGSMKCGTLNISDASGPRTVTFPSGSTVIVDTFNIQGTSGNRITLNASTPGSPATVSKAYGAVSVDYLSIQDSAATGGASWYAGANSINVSGNSGWFFTPPTNSAFLSFL